MKLFQSLLLCLLSLPLASAHAGEGGYGPGNGGDPRSLEFMEIAYEWADALQAHPHTLRAVSATRWDRLLSSLELQWLDSGRPDCTEIYTGPPGLRSVLENATCSHTPAPVIEIEGRSWANASQQRCTARWLVLHALLPLVGVSDTHYVTTQRLIREFYPALPEGACPGNL